MPTPNRPPRPRLTSAILGYALTDVVGIVLLALGIGYLAQGPGVFFANFPSTTVEAVLLTAAGAALMLWSAAQILRQVAHQAAERDR